MLFHRDNALAHMSTVTMAAIQKCGFQLIKDPPYSPDLAPSDYYLFLKMNKELCGHHFAVDDDIMNAVDHFLRDQNGTSYTQGNRLLHAHWTKCVNVGEEYVEKLLFDFLKLNSSTLGHRHINNP